MDETGSLFASLGTNKLPCVFICALLLKILILLVCASTTKLNN